MTTIVKTFFIEKKEICPNEINAKLERYYSSIKNNDCLKGDLYGINGNGIIKGVIRYHMNLFEILTYDKRENYQIKSELEKILNIKLVEPQ